MRLVEKKRLAEVAQRAVDEAERALEFGVDLATLKVEQELSYLGAFHTAVENMDPDLDRRELAIVGEKVEDLQSCKRDTYGLCLSADNKMLMSPPVISSVLGIDETVLQFQLDAATMGLGLNAGTGRSARGARTYTLLLRIYTTTPTKKQY